MSRTLLEKIWESHVVHRVTDMPDLLYVDMHLLNEVSCPQAFTSLRQAGRGVRRPDLTLATADHNTPTWTDNRPIADQLSIIQLSAIERNCRDFGIRLEPYRAPGQGIVHVIGPELGLTHPGSVIVCGDSHTSTHGAFGALAFGIGTTQIEHVLATQSLRMVKPKTMEVRVEGTLGPGLTAKDLVLWIIAKIGVDGGVGHVIEYSGPVVERLSMEGRMTVCNMSIEAGARAGMVGADDVTFSYLEGRPHSPEGRLWEQALDHWRTCRTDPGAKFDRVISVSLEGMAPMVTWGTNPGMVVDIGGRVPSPADFSDPGRQQQVGRALEYMGLEPGTPITDIRLDRVFIGSCTNSRIEDLRAAAAVARGHRVADGVTVLVVPGSMAVKAQAEREGLDRIFKEAGFEWRESGCSMCIGMNPDRLRPRERCASTSNRNFEGRQGDLGRTHLVSPAMAAAAAIAGHFVDVRSWAPDALAPTGV